MSNEEFNEDDFDDEEILLNYRERRMQELKKQQAQVLQMKDNQHGQYIELKEEKEFLKITTSTKLVVVHFFHEEFQRCKIVDKHLSILAQKHFRTRFVKINVEKAPFFVEKLQIKVLPCVISFIDGVAADRIVGFDDLGNRDDFSTALFEKRLSDSGIIPRADSVLTIQQKREKGLKNRDSDDEDY